MFSERAKPFVVHLNKLKKCYGTTPMSWLGSGDEPRTSEGDARMGVSPAPEVLHSPVQNDVFDFSSDVLCDNSPPSAVQKLPARRCSQPTHVSDFVC